jgi:hypothetical protein
LLREQALPLHERLDAVRGRDEWVVTVHRVGQPDQAAFEQVSEAVRQLRAEVTAASPGRAHLLKRRLAEVERDEVRRLDAHVAAEIGREVEQLSVDVYREALPNDAVERPILRCSALVERARQAGLIDLIERLQLRWQPGYRLQLTGPWPPYRFAGLPAAERDVAAR